VIEIIGDKLDDLVSQLVVGINVLEAGKDGNYFVSAFKVELDLCDRAGIETILALVGFSNHVHSSKISC
jgi:hypothetical protein